MYLSDIHTHSIASGHGTTCTISDMAKAASKKGLKLLGISEHGPGTLASGTSSYFRSLPFYPRKRFGIDILYGVELNILDSAGHTDLSDELLNNLDYGYHQYASAELPFRLCISEYRSLHQCNETSCCKNTRPLRRYTFPCRL